MRLASFRCIRRSQPTWNGGTSRCWALVPLLGIAQTPATAGKSRPTRFNIPGGLNAGQEISYIFDRVALPYSQLRSFDELPIPFRCVATELITGKRYGFNRLPLGEALRSTMSLHAMFAPVKHGRSVYADGGLLDNLPVEVVKDMGADIVIAVAISLATFNGDGNLSMFSVMGRSISIMISANELRSMQAADLISVDVAGFSSTAYTSGSRIISRGYEGASRTSQLLSRLALDEAAWQQHLEERRLKQIHSTPIPTFVEVNELPKPLASEIEKVLSAHIDKPVDISKLEQDMNLVAGTGRFLSFSYHTATKEGKEGLVIRAEEKQCAAIPQPRHHH
jgi:NTE family protein